MVLITSQVAPKIHGQLSSQFRVEWPNSVDLTQLT